MTTSELRRMATPLLERPLIPPETIEDLKERSGGRRRWQRASWTHRVWVVAVAAAILVVFFVPLPRASLFHNLVAPTQTTPTKLPPPGAPRAYGTGPLRFEAAFPSSAGPTYVVAPIKAALSVTTCSPREAFEVQVYDSALLPPNSGPPFLVKHPCWLDHVQFWPGGHGKRTTSTVHGYLVVRTSVFCLPPTLRGDGGKRLCEFGEWVERASTEWVLTVYAPTRKAVTEFVASFKPLP